VYVKNLKVYRKSPKGGVISGYDDAHKVSNVVFSNYILEGRKVTAMEDADISNTKFSEGIRFE
jgi:hypothetical protein